MVDLRRFPDGPPTLVVAVGTDVHPFDRLVRWADLWALEHPEERVLVQYGTSRPPRWADGRAALGRDELVALFSACEVAVVSCGPGAVMDARRAGRRPVVVPRRADLGEHVDDHQGVFARHLDETGMAVLVEDEPSLRTVLSASRDGLQLSPRDRDRPADGSGRHRIGTLVDRLVWTS